MTRFEPEALRLIINVVLSITDAFFHQGITLYNQSLMNKKYIFKYKNIKLSVFFIISFNIVSGQISDNTKTKWHKITIYEYGFPLTSCECNFKNLFDNWSTWVTNSKDTELLSYEYVETIINNKLKERYAKKMNNINLLGRRLDDISKEKINDIDTTYTRELYINFYPLDSIPEGIINLEEAKRENYFSVMNSYLKLMEEQFKNIINLGDYAYKIKLKINRKEEYEHYVICRPQENKIVYDNLFLAIREFRHHLD